MKQNKKPGSWSNKTESRAFASLTVDPAFQMPTQALPEVITEGRARNKT